MFSPERIPGKLPRSASGQSKSSPVGPRSTKLAKTPDSVSKASVSKKSHNSGFKIPKSSDYSIDEVSGEGNSILASNLENNEEFDLDVLKTHLFQLRFLRLKLSDAAIEEKKKAESDLLRFWKLAYDAEEEAEALTGKHDVATEVLRAHAAIQTVVC